MRFAMLYSCGKDSALALHRMVAEGHEPVCLIVTYNRQAGRSWFHGVSPALLNATADSLGIPLIRCDCTGDSYQAEVERRLLEARALGAQAAAFGDIDIAEHLDWNRARCKRAGLECAVPLWGQSRKALVHAVIAAGFRAVVKCVDLRRLDKSFLGKTLDQPLAERIAATGSDICGENGEYHTFVWDGPTYKTPIPICLGDTVDGGTHAAVDILPARPAGD